MARAPRFLFPETCKAKVSRNDVGLMRSGTVAAIVFEKKTKGIE